MNTLIRDFNNEDRAAYLDMALVFYQSDAVMHSIPKEHFEKTFALCVERHPYVRGLMVLVNGKPAGYAILSLTWSNEAGGVCVLMEEAFILPEHQGKGLGSAVFAFVEKEYIENGGARRLRLEVTKVNQRAVSLYERQGFQRLDYIQMIKDV